MIEFEYLKKKIIYKSVHRGSKENDLLLGKCIRKYINDLNKKELEILNEFLNESDLKIFDWFCKKQPIPENYKKITELFINFIYCNK